MARNFLRYWLGGRSSAGAGPAARGRQGIRPALETLESRWAPAVALASQQIFATGGGPTVVVVGDFNGDGRPDLAIANQFDSTVSVLLNITPAGAATPTYAAPQTFATGTHPDGLAVGDFNGDGRPDLVVTNFNDKTVSVLLDTTVAGSVTPSFLAQQTFAVGTNPARAVVGDFNGDGRPDIAVADYGDNTVSVLLNATPAGSAAPAFAAQQTFATGKNPYALTAGDFNGDGRPDLAVANYGDNTVSVLLNATPAGSAAPAFAAQQAFAVGTVPFSIAARDLDGDGRPDLAVANGGGANVISVLVNATAPGAGTAAFAAQQTFAAGGGPTSVAVGDFNGDGRPDLAVTNGADRTVSVLLNATFPFANAAPVVVGQFGTTGVWEFNRLTGVWVQLTAANATRLAADAHGDVVAAFPGYGVWEYKPMSGWKQLNGVDAVALAIDAYGDVAAAFPGYGVGEYVPVSGWRSLTAANATLLAMDAQGDVTGEFPGNGVWEYKPAAGWKQLNGVDATLLAMDARGDVVANFAGVGVGEYLPASGWKLLNGTQAKALTIDAQGDVTAVFQGYGTAQYAPSAGWRTLTGSNAVALAVDALGDVYGAFPGYGVWEYDAYRGWVQINKTDASLLAVG